MYNIYEYIILNIIHILLSKITKVIKGNRGCYHEIIIKFTIVYICIYIYIYIYIYICIRVYVSLKE